MITLIGKDIAKEGLSFVFYGPLEECSSCRFKSSCIDSLEMGHKYTITGLKDSEQKCPIHDEEKVKVVVVEDAEMTILTDSKGVFEGSSFVHGGMDCSNEDCDFRDLCFAEGLIKDMKYTYVKDLGKFKECPDGIPLRKTVVKLNSK